MGYQSPREYVLELEQKEGGPLGWNMTPWYVSPFNKPDICPQCSSTDVHRSDTWPGCWGGIVLTGDCYYCSSCKFSERSVSFISGGTHVPESNWWSLTKYPISWWEETLKNAIDEEIEHYESLDSIVNIKKHATDMMWKLGKKCSTS